MTFREEQELEEQQRLSPFAALSRESKGRRQPLAPCQLRTCYQRDRDRIIHCKSFRRLKFKTQVFLSPKGDHYRTRLTHTLEVAQVARTIARSLRLNEDLTEAIALGHDLGHTPFGHIGERTLDRLVAGGFRHNEQSLRVADRLESNGRGLNLCRETLDGIRNHSGRELPATLEGWCVRRADRIAYINHDIDDAIRGGILKPFELPRRCLSVLGQSHGERINTMIADIVTTAGADIRAAIDEIRFTRGEDAPVTTEDVLAATGERPFIRMSTEVEEASDELRSFLFTNVYHDSWRAREEEKCDYVVEALFDHYSRHPEQLPAEYLEICYTEGAERAVCDFVACMTDRYAIDRFTEISVPAAFGNL